MANEHIEDAALSVGIHLNSSGVEGELSSTLTSAERSALRGGGRIGDAIHAGVKQGTDKAAAEVRKLTLVQNQAARARQSAGGLLAGVGSEVNSEIRSRITSATGLNVGGLLGSLPPGVAGPLKSGAGRTAGAFASKALRMLPGIGTAVGGGLLLADALGLSPGKIFGGIGSLFSGGKHPARYQGPHSYAVDPLDALRRSAGTQLLPGLSGDGSLDVDTAEEKRRRLIATADKSVADNRLKLTRATQDLQRAEESLSDNRRRKVVKDASAVITAEAGLHRAQDRLDAALKSKDPTRITSAREALGLRQSALARAQAGITDPSTTAVLHAQRRVADDKAKLAAAQTAAGTARKDTAALTPAQILARVTGSANRESRTATLAGRLAALGLDPREIRQLIGQEAEHKGTLAALVKSGRPGVSAVQAQFERLLRAQSRYQTDGKTDPLLDPFTAGAKTRAAQLAAHFGAGNRPEYTGGPAPLSLPKTPGTGADPRAYRLNGGANPYLGTFDPDAGRPVRGATNVEVNLYVDGQLVTGAPVRKSVRTRVDVRPTRSTSTTGRSS